MKVCENPADGADERWAGEPDGKFDLGTAPAGTLVCSSDPFDDFDDDDFDDEFDDDFEEEWDVDLPGEDDLEEDDDFDDDDDFED